MTRSLNSKTEQSNIAVEERAGITGSPYINTSEGRAAKELGLLPPRTTKEANWQNEVIKRYLNNACICREYPVFSWVRWYHVVWLVLSIFLLVTFVLPSPWEIFWALFIVCGPKEIKDLVSREKQNYYCTCKEDNGIRS